MRATSSSESTVVLLERVREGSDDARNALVARFLPMLRSWAHGRLPLTARSNAETDDLVQVTLIKALDRADQFEYLREGAFLAYLRKILLNQMRDEIRRATRRPQHELDERELVSAEASLVEKAIGRQAMERYEEVLAQLPVQQREATILRLEFGYSHQEVADAAGFSSADAARMSVARSVVRLAEALR